MSPARKIIAWDVETAPLPEAEIAHLMPEFKPPANYKDPEKIKAWLTEAKQLWLLNAALDPVSGRVDAIGYTMLNSTGMHHSIRTVPDDGTESDIINDFWVKTVMANNQEWVGFNCFKFDLPFLVRRSWKLGIIPPANIRTDRFWSDQFLDLMQVWQMGDRQEYISLDRMSKFLGVGGKAGDGALFHKLDHQQKVDYLMNDLTLTMKIAQKLLCQ